MLVHLLLCCSASGSCCSDRDALMEVFPLGLQFLRPPQGLDLSTVWLLLLMLLHQRTVQGKKRESFPGFDGLWRKTL